MSTENVLWFLGRLLEQSLVVADLKVSEQGNPVRAARSWGAAEALRENIGATTAPLDRAAYGRYVVETCARLGEAAFAAAWAKGRAMTPEEAVEDALDKRE